MAHSEVMCLAFLRIPASTSESLVLATNRDEFFDRPSAPADWWRDAPGILGGKDLKEGGTWLAVSRDGRFGLITNFREPQAQHANRLSRGAIIAEFLKGDFSPDRFLDHLAASSGQYSPFNLVVGTAPDEVLFFSSREKTPIRLSAGVHGISNGDLNSAWPKVTRGARRFEAITKTGFDRPRLLEMMTDRSIAPDPDLPATGVPKEIERALSATFIHLPGYGTRNTTLLQMDRTGHAEFFERTYSADGLPGGDAEFSFDFQSAAK